MTSKKFFTTLGGAGFLAFIILSLSGVHQPTTVSWAAEQSPHSKALRGDSKKNEVALLAATEPRLQLDSFEIIEKRYALLNRDEAQLEVHRIDDEAQKVAFKNFNDFSVDERAAFLNRQREKAVLVNKIILARLERIQK